ncbi:hypothetical protein PJP10_32895, partial [Mycobacterium kansasii]
WRMENCGFAAQEKELKVLHKYEKRWVKELSFSMEYCSFEMIAFWELIAETKHRVFLLNVLPFKGTCIFRTCISKT